MHLVSKLLALAATSALGAHAFETSIFTFPSNDNQNGHTTSERRTVSEDVAELILELRIQSSLQSVLGRVETDIVDRINEFSGAQYALFGADGNHATQRRSMILLEGVNQAVGMSEVNYPLDTAITNGSRFPLSGRFHHPRRTTAECCRFSCVAELGG